MPQNKDGTGVAKKIDIESMSEDLAELAKQLGAHAEGPVDSGVLKRMQDKIERITTPEARS